MSDKYFVDTNILIYAHDPAMGLKHRRALELIEDLWRTGQAVLSTQVLQEFCVNVRRKAAHPLSLAKVRLLVRNYSAWEVVTNTPESILMAMDMEQRYKISFWDALILQAAEEAGASALYSEDLPAGQRYGSVRVINPFAVPAAL
jgi:predicted nucleic acid-binding protein